MTHDIAMRISKTILFLAGIGLAALLTLGATRAIIVETPATQSTSELSSKSPEKPLDTSIAATVPPTDVAIDIPPVANAVDTVSAIQSKPASPFVVKRILQIDEPFVHGYYKWDDEGVPDGEIVITVDLKAESLSVFRDGYEIGATVIKFGDALKPTPTGVFPITQKSKDHVSNIYHVPMPHMLRLTNDGIAIHAAEVKWGYGTRGCIGVPHEFARLLFEQVKLGDRVIVTNGKMLDLGEPIVAG